MPLLNGRVKNRPAGLDEAKKKRIEGNPPGLRRCLRYDWLKPRGSGRAGGVIHYPPDGVRPLKPSPTNEDTTRHRRAGGSAAQP